MARPRSSPWRLEPTLADLEPAPASENSPRGAKDRYERWLDSAGTPPNVRANDPAGDQLLPTAETQSECAVAAFQSNVVVAWNDSKGLRLPASNTVSDFAWPTDGGQTWTDGGSVPLLAAGDQSYGDCTLDVDNAGNFYLATIYVNNATGTQDVAVPDKSYQWSEDWIKKYFGERKKFTYASVLADGYLQKENADTSLIRLIKNDLYPEMVRATAISYLSAYENPKADSVIVEMLYNLEALVRERAFDAFNTSDAEELVKVISPLLDDPIKMVRIAAASKLSVLEKEFFTEEQFKKLNDVLDEYLQTLIYTTDFPTGKYNLGNFYSNKGDFVKAEKYYLDAIKMDKQFYPAKSNLNLGAHVGAVLGMNWCLNRDTFADGCAHFSEVLDLLRVVRQQAHGFDA